MIYLTFIKIILKPKPTIITSLWFYKVSLCWETDHFQKVYLHNNLSNFHTFGPSTKDFDVWNSHSFTNYNNYNVKSFYLNTYAKLINLMNNFANSCCHYCCYFLLCYLYECKTVKLFKNLNDSISVWNHFEYKNCTWKL